MSKIIWGGAGVCAALIAVGAGAKIYADKNLASYYQQPTIEHQNYRLKYSNYQMGALSGKANVEFSYQRDPCVAESQLNFIGQDEIKRTWQGYEIYTTLTLTASKDKYAYVFNQPVKAVTIIPWTGNIQTRVEMPKIEVTSENNKLSLAPIQLILNSQLKDQATRFKDIQVLMPNMSFQNEKGQITVRDVSIQTNQGLNQAVLEPGYLQWKVNNIQINLSGINAASMTLNQFDMQVETLLKDQLVDINSVIKVADVATQQNKTYKNIEYHFDLKELNRAQLESYLQVFYQADNSCAASKTLDKDALSAFTQLFNAGFVFESKNNKMQTDYGELNANLTAKIMPNYVNSAESLVKMFPSLVDANMDVSLDKDLFKSFLQLMPNRSAALSDSEMEMMLKSFEEQGKIQREGNQIKMGLQYKYGQPTYHQYH